MSDAGKSVNVVIKPWYKSKVIWIAVLTGLVGASEALSGGGIFGSEIIGWLLIAKSVLEIIVRKLTEAPIG